MGWRSGIHWEKEGPTCGWCGWRPEKAGSSTAGRCTSAPGSVAAEAGWVWGALTVLRCCIVLLRCALRFWAPFSASQRPHLLLPAVGQTGRQADSRQAWLEHELVLAGAYSAVLGGGHRAQCVRKQLMAPCLLMLCSSSYPPAELPVTVERLPAERRPPSLCVWRCWMRR